MSSIPDRCRRLVDAILSAFDAGLIIDEHARYYIDTCLPGMSLEALAREFSETPDLEIASLMDLVFFPDETFQTAVEPLLQSETYSPEDEALTVMLLSANPVQTTLREPDGPSTAAFRMPTSAIAPFVHRMHINKRIPQALADTIYTMHPPEKAARLTVCIRNARVDLSETTGSFLISFFLGMAPEDPDHNACFETVLALLGEELTVADPFRLLRAKIDSLHKAREAIRAFEAQLRIHNMETLMHMGARAPETGITEVEKKIGLLEKIGDAIALGGVIARRQV